VNLDAFTDASQRDMAIEAGLKLEYDLSYAPLSSANPATGLPSEMSI
jgi:hypothetical protein